jgi:glycosyltransferase involved in cell wall biosynthesis
MKIAIYHNLPSGGAKHTLYETAKRLFPKHTLDVYRLSTSDEEFYNLSKFINTERVFHFSPAKLFGSPFGRLNQLQRFLDLQRLDRLARRIARQVDEGEYDIVFAQPCMWTQAPLVLRYLRTPAIYYCHEPPRSLYEAAFGDVGSSPMARRIIDAIDPFIWLYRFTGRRYDYQATRSAKLVLVNSIFIHDQVKGIYGINPKVSYHGVDTDTFYPAPKNSNGSYVLSVGAIQPHKGYDFLIESFTYIDKSIRPSLRLIGNAENSGMQKHLQGLAEKQEVDLQIELKLDQEELVERYNNALLIAYAPYNEPFGLVPLEAMACARPVVGIQEGGVIETVVNEKTGLLINRDPEKFGKAIQHLLENPLLSEQYGRNGREHILEYWSWGKSVKNLEQTMYNLIQ